ncbi:MAG: CRISPR-associated ring nuclease [Polyangiales bacterium]
MIDAVLLAELGPNPAALAEALWALPRLHDTRVTHAFVLTSRAGHAWFTRELLASSVYDQLGACLGDAVPPLARVHLQVVPGDDELDPADADAWNEARWANATAALRAAGDRPVVFALAGGRQRTSAAITTVMFQLLARPQDRLVDVRVGDRRVEGARAGFFFPEQARQLLFDRGESFLARDVPVHLVEVRVPRLRRLLGGRVMPTWADALAAGQRAVEAVPQVELSLDLAAARVTLNGAAVAFTESEFVWFATLARARRDDDGEGWARSSDPAGPRAVLCAMRDARGGAWTPSSTAWRAVLTTGSCDGDEAALLSKFRSTAAARYRKALAALGLPRALEKQLALQKVDRWVGGKETAWRLPLDPACITLR